MSGNKGAVRLGDLADQHDGYPLTPAIAGSQDVLINGRPAVRQGDPAVPHSKPKNPTHPRAAAEGAGSVLVNGKPAVRIGDNVSCGGTWVKGSGDVLIGDSPKNPNPITPAEWDEFMHDLIHNFPDEDRTNKYKRAELAAQKAVKFRGAEGARATWREYYNGAKGRGEPPPDPARIKDANQLAALMDVEPSPADAGGLWESVVGGAKAFFNDLMRRNAGMLAEYFAEQGVFKFKDAETGEALTPEQAAQRYQANSPATLPIEGAAEQRGADWTRAALPLAAVVELTTAAASKGRSVIRDPDGFAREIHQALRNSRSSEEAMGKLGQMRAKERMGETTDPRYVDRYHGPDDMTSNRRLTEWEAKGGKGDRAAPARNKSGETQGSARKNKRRAKQMARDKAGKVGQPSKRQGGPYAAEEIDLWKEIEHRDGNKRHLLSHTNMETGRVRVFEQDKKGNLGEVVDEFQMDDFAEAKEVIEKALQQ